MIRVLEVLEIANEPCPVLQIKSRLFLCNYEVACLIFCVCFLQLIDSIAKTFIGTNAYMAVSRPLNVLFVVLVTDIATTCMFKY